MAGIHTLVGRKASNAVSVAINPGSSSTFGGASAFSTHTVVVSNGVASAFSWNVLDGGAINGATNAAAASLRGDNGIQRNYSCDVTVGGVVYTPHCSREHFT
jgi:hypothetical protein